MLQMELHGKEKQSIPLQAVFESNLFLHMDVIQSAETNVHTCTFGAVKMSAFRSSKLRSGISWNSDTALLNLDAPTPIGK